MKNEFIIAFNEICQARGLPQDVVIEALKTALVSAYRRSVNISNNQQVAVEIDRHTGEPTVYAEKEVVELVTHPLTEVSLDEALQNGFKTAALGEVVMVISTPPDFGRIAAQTAKQVILQRVREAEREQLYQEFASREGEIVNGTVQSVSGVNITIGLGRTEALLPSSQQVRGERYRAHDKIRVYVLEVKRTSKGPSIIVSRNHRNLLRRLLELEVPEIYNGQVEIKSIAREAGARSKVAVLGLQPGVDPVGACVGMRGVRIQSIVRELNDEKIDVIEWDADPKSFIAKALSPARVSQVFLEDDPIEGKTAVVIVPDDQLSLAIGREGQNARLAAKLTNWRIDIKSLTEAAIESFDLLDHPAADRQLARNKELLDQAKQVLAKKEASRPITAEDYGVLNRLVMGTLGRVLMDRVNKLEEMKKRRTEARKRVSKEMWDVSVQELDMPARIQNLLDENKLGTLGDVLFHIEQGDEAILKLKGFGEKSLEILKEGIQSYLASKSAAVIEETVIIPEEPVVDETDLPSEPPIAVVPEQPPVVELKEEESDEEEEDLSDITQEESEEEEEYSFIDDLNRPLVSVPTTLAKKEPDRKSVVVVTPRSTDSTKPSLQPSKGGSKKPKKGKQLVYDESVGGVVAKRKRKRRAGDWTAGDFDDF